MAVTLVVNQGLVDQTGEELSNDMVFIDLTADNVNQDPTTHRSSQFLPAVTQLQRRQSVYDEIIVASQNRGRRRRGNRLISQPRSCTREKSRERSRSYTRSRSRSRSRGRSRGHSRGRSRGNSRNHSRGRSRGNSRGHSRGRSRGNSRGHSRGRSRGNSRGHSKDRTQSRVRYLRKKYHTHCKCHKECNVLRNTTSEQRRNYSRRTGKRNSI